MKQTRHSAEVLWQSQWHTDGFVELAASLSRELHAATPSLHDAPPRLPGMHVNICSLKCREHVWILMNTFSGTPFSMAVVGLIAFISFSFGVNDTRQKLKFGFRAVGSWHSSSTQCTMALYANFYHTVYMQIVPSVLWRCWLGGRKGIRPVKNWVVGCWRGYLSGASCRLANVPADATATHCLAAVKSRLVLPFWYRLTWVVPEKGPLNGCVCVCLYADCLLTD